MDLREKPGKIQNILEFILRLRLIWVVLLVILSVTFVATGYEQMNRFPLASSESLGMWIANAEGLGAVWNSAQYLCVAFVSMVVLLFVFGGVRCGLGGTVSSILMVLALYALGGSEGMQTVFFGTFAGLSLILLLVPAIRLSIACSLFPYALSWLLLTGFLSKSPVMVGEDSLVWACLSTLGFACSVALSLSAGKELSLGSPQAGALVKAAKKMVLPVSISSLLVLAALTFDMNAWGSSQILSAVVIWIAFNVWFFAFFLGTCSFAPWERLRSGSRRVEMKEKKKKNGKK